MDNVIERVIFTEEDIKNRIAEVGKQITEDFRDKQDEGIIVVSVLKGAAIFMADLIRSIDLKMKIDFMAVSSYYNSTVTSGKARIEQDMSGSVEGKHLIIAEDVIDSGITLNFLLSHFKERGAASITIAAFLHKHIEETPLDVKYVCFDCPKDFIVGYGLDYAQEYRNLPYIGVLKPELYK